MCDCSVTYTLPEITPEEQYRQPAELQPGETTARISIYELLGAMLAVPDAETHIITVSAGWSASLGREVALLSYPVYFGKPALPPGASLEQFHREYARLFGDHKGAGGIAPLIADAWFDEADGDRHREEVAHFFEYYGMALSPEDPRPAGHLATALEFMRHLTFSEAAACSPRLQQTFRAAQRDFLERMLIPWLPRLRDRVNASDRLGFWAWATNSIGAFAAADLACLQAPASCNAQEPVAAHAS